MDDAMEESRTTDALEQLAEVVEQVVKALRGQRQPVTANSLHTALAKRPDLRNLLREDAVIRAESACVAANVDDPGLMKSQLQVLGDQKARLLQDVLQLEEQQKGLWDFSIGSLVTFVSWLEVSSKRAHFRKAINRFKSEVKEAQDLATLEGSFAALKDQVLKESIESLDTGERREESKFSFKHWLGGKGQELDRIAVEGSKDFLEKLKELLIAFLEELETSLPGPVDKELDESRRLVSACETCEDMLALREPLLRLGQLCGQSFHGERDLFARLIKEIDQYLGEMEENLLDSMGQARAMAEANTNFDHQMAQGMTEMSESLAVSQDLDSLHQVVVSKLAFLRQALENKRKNDEQQLARVNEKMEDLQRNVAHMRQEVSMAREQSRQLEEQLQKDGLTGTLNRRGYEDRIAQEFERFLRYRHMLSVVVFDLDHFKRVNDQFGHQRGDRCLKVISARVAPEIRKSDALARYGGDEFVLILPGIGQDEAAKVAEKIRCMVEQLRFLYEGRRLPMTLSMGVAQARDSDATAEDLFRRADQALYAAKAEGRNRVKVYTDEDHPGGNDFETDAIVA
jgi:diguanylate cyclase